MSGSEWCLMLGRADYLALGQVGWRFQDEMPGNEVKP